MKIRKTFLYVSNTQAVSHVSNRAGSFRAECMVANEYLSKTDVLALKGNRYSYKVV